ncbi:MAG: decaprenyl-phosphate phosphoribosyltransferase [candidate division Zixibacteria bacterium]|nr:decaprenyl-phosphate phosphoribosyltransferase [candidate division Zixibacteria bacterium]
MIRDLFILVRPSQWLKNGVVLAALVFAGEAQHTGQLLRALTAAGLFCLFSSAVYIFNDLIDRESDRQHPRKRNRPLASGRVTAGSAVSLMVVLVLVGLIGAWFLNLSFLLVGLCFLLLNFLYTLVLKNIVILDAMSVAISFVIRAYAGAFAIGVPASKWLLINTLFLALFLAFGKRRHELVSLSENASAHRQSLGRYSPYLLDQCIGVTTAAVVVMYMLYTFSTEVSSRLGTEYLYLTIPFVVYGVFRYLYLIHKQEQGGSPTRVLIGDRPILITVILWLVTVLVILYYLR